MFKEISKVDKQKSIYKGTLIDGTLFENHLFSYGDPIIIADAYVNARGPREAMNKLLDRCDLNQYNYTRKEEFKDDVNYGYLEVQEADYYDEEDDCTYKYYCKVVYYDRKRGH